MRNRHVSSIAAAVAVLAFSSLAFAQTAQQSPGAKAQKAAVAPQHDLSGVWSYTVGVPKGQGIYATLSKDVPPRTAWGETQYLANKPGYGPRATDAADNTDPILQCDPTGLPRVLLYFHPVEIIQIPGRVLQFFEHDHLWREIWTDGRPLPKDPDPAWYGYSVGKWQADGTFVVDTIGLNDKTWADFYGNPHTEDMHLTERYQRVDHDTLNLTITLDDPKAYTKPWVSDTKIWKLEPAAVNVEEAFCVPSEEDAFTKLIRKPGANITNK
jgi:hypothetical protein